MGLKKPAKEKGADTPLLKKNDRIFQAMILRKDAGSLTSTVARDPTAEPELVFKLKLKGSQPKIAATAVIDPEELKRQALEGPKIDHAKLKKEDVIMHSLEHRKKAGTLTSTIPVDK